MPDSVSYFIRNLIAVIVIHAMVSVAVADTISVNFNVGDDSDAQADHELTGSEVAGLDGNTTWNNINVGAGGTHIGKPVMIFDSTVLTDDAGDTRAASLAPSALSKWFVGYAASAAAHAKELGLPGNHDDLFNSYLALNGPDGDGNPADAAVLQITGLGEAYTSNGYTLIIYSDTDKGRSIKGGDVRTSQFVVTPAGGRPIIKFTEDYGLSERNTFDGTYVESDGIVDGIDYSNYVVFADLTASDFDLSIYSDDGGRGAISGFQIVANSKSHTATIPEPRTCGLLMGVLVAACVMRRRNQR